MSNQPQVEKPQNTTDECFGPRWLCNDRAGKDVQRLSVCFWLQLEVSLAAEQRKVAFSSCPAKLCCNCLQRPVSAPNSWSNVRVASGDVIYIIPYMGRAHVRADFTLVFPALIQAGIFLSLHNAFQQGAEANFQVFPVFLLSDSSRSQCCRAPGPLPSARGVEGHSLQAPQKPGLLLEKQNIWHVPDSPLAAWGASGSSNHSSHSCLVLASLLQRDLGITEPSILLGTSMGMGKGVGHHQLGAAKGFLGS